MAISEATPVETLKKLAFKRRNIQDDMVADYLAMVIKPGDKTLQLGSSEFGSVFLQRGAFHQLVGNNKAVSTLQDMCQRRAIREDRLQITSKLSKNDKQTGLDAVLLGSGLGFSALASSWPLLADRLKTGGVLVLTGASQGGSARLSEALLADKGWALQEMIGSNVSVFRKTVNFIAETDSKAAKKDYSTPAKRSQPDMLAGVFRTLFGGSNTFHNRQT